jgi:hypothetical protein
VIPFTVTITEDLMTKRDANIACRGIMGSLARHHLRINLPKHFSNAPETSPGNGGYRYRRRSKRWNAIKLRKYGHQIPNVARGTMRKTVLSSSRLTSTATRWRLYSKTPAIAVKDERGNVVLNKRTKRPKFTRATPYWQRAEIEAVSNKEIREFARMYEDLFRRAVGSPRFKRKRKVRRGAE